MPTISVSNGQAPASDQRRSPLGNALRLAACFRHWWVLALGLVLTLALVTRWMLALNAPVFLEGDSQSYLLPAWELANGSGFSPELRRAPGYSSFIAAAFLLLGQHLDAIALAQHALGLATVALTFLLGRRLFGTWAGILASLAVALSGPQLIYERYVMSEVLFGFVILATSLILVLAIQVGRPSSRPAESSVAATTPVPASAPTPMRRQTAALVVLGGVAIGLAVLVRPVAQAILPLYLLALLLVRPRWRTAVVAAGLALAGYALVVAPWTIRNLTAHETALAAGGLGRSLIARTVKYDTLFDWKWLSETHGGQDDLDSRARMLLYRKRGNIQNGRSVRPYQDALLEELGLSQGQAETLMRQIALEAIARRPLDYLGGSLLFSGEVFLGREERLQSHWKQRANKDWGEQWDDRLDFLVTPVEPWHLAAPSPAAPLDVLQRQQFSLTLLDLYQPYRMGWLLGLLFLAGCLVAWQQTTSRPAILLAAVALAMVSLSAFLDGPVIRYRYPVDPLISVVAAGGLVGLVRLVSHLVNTRPAGASVRSGTGQPNLSARPVRDPLPDASVE